MRDPLVVGALILAAGLIGLTIGHDLGTNTVPCPPSTITTVHQEDTP